MAFYIFPPKGNLSLGKLELHTRKRLDFLMKLAGKDSKGNRINVEMWSNVQTTVSAMDILVTYVVPSTYAVR